jgi:hypothetical protein
LNQLELIVNETDHAGAGIPTPLDLLDQVAPGLDENNRIIRANLSDS